MQWNGPISILWTDALITLSLKQRAVPGVHAAAVDVRDDAAAGAVEAVDDHGRDEEAEPQGGAGEGWGGRGEWEERGGGGMNAVMDA